MDPHIVSFRSKIKSSSQEIFDWHQRPSAFERLIPPWMQYKAISQKGKLNQVGSKTTLKIKIGPVWRKWVVEHQDVVENRSFVDTQIEGPFKYFKHYHRIYNSCENTCEIEDEIHFIAPFSFLAEKVEKEIKRILKWRHKRIDAELEVKARYLDKKLRILVSGGSGLVGSSLIPFLKTAGHEVFRLVRKDSDKGEDAIFWDPKLAKASKESFEGFDAVIHLAGKNLASQIWTQKFKKEIFLSRCRDSWFLSNLLLRAQSPPKTLICASAIGYYGNRVDETLTETSGSGSGFLADLCKKWEESTSSIESKGTRGVHTRFGLILSQKGGMLAKLLPIFRMGLGVTIGAKKQNMSWIALDDVIYGLYHTLMTPSIEGPVNFTAPFPETSQTFSEKLAQSLHRPIFLRIGEKPLKWAFGEMADEMLLMSAKALPDKLKASGYQFQFQMLDEFLTMSFS